MSESRKLLKEYVSSRSEPAFHELVERYVNLVHSVALRLAGGDTHLAEDVTQIVFADLAVVAPKLPERVLLGGWLHQHTCFVTNRTLRTERRRRIRERQAAEMNSQQNHTEANLARIAPILDEAIGRLTKSDRAAIILRYFEQYDLRSVGEALGTTEDAAQKRLTRALEKLHVLLKHRGVTLSVAALGTALAAEAVTAAPAGLVGNVVATALASAAAVGGATATLAKLLTVTKLKVTILSVIAVAGVATPLAIQHQSQARLREENEALRKQAVQLAQIAAENESLSNLVLQTKGAESLSREQINELLRLRGERGELLRLRNEVNQRRERQAQLTEEARRAREEAANAKGALEGLLGLSIREDPREVETRPLKSASIAFRIYAMEHNGTFPSAFSQLEPFLAGDETNLLAQWEAQLEIVSGEHTTNSPPSSVIVQAKHRDVSGKRWGVNADGSITLRADER